MARAAVPDPWPGRAVGAVLGADSAPGPCRRGASYRDFADEAGASWGLGLLRVRFAISTARLVPLDAFLYGRIVEAVRTRHRQEWAYGRRPAPARRIVNQSAPKRGEPDPDFEADTLTPGVRLGRLGETDLGLIRQFFWKGRRRTTWPANAASASRLSAAEIRRSSSNCGMRCGGPEDRHREKFSQEIEKYLLSLILGVPCF